MNNEELVVSVTGGEVQQRAIVGSIIESALTDQGFSAVTNSVTGIEGVTYDKERTVSLLDVIKSTMPSIMETSIEIIDGGEPVISDELLTDVPAFEDETES